MIIPNRILFAGYSLSILLVTLSGYLLPTSVQAQVAGDATVGTQVNGQLTNPCIGGLCTIKGALLLGGIYSIASVAFLYLLVERHGLIRRV